MLDKTNEYHPRNWSLSPDGQRTENLQYIQYVLEPGRLETFSQQLLNIPCTQWAESLWSCNNPEVGVL